MRLVQKILLMNGLMTFIIMLAFVFINGYDYFESVSIGFLSFILLNQVVLMSITTKQNGKR